MEKIILNTSTAVVVQTPTDVVLRIKMEAGQWVACKPYTNDAKGVVAALTAAIDVLCGKIWLDHVVVSTETPRLKALNPDNVKQLPKL
jgi:hypothetical protein